VSLVFRCLLGCYSCLCECMYVCMRYFIWRQIPRMFMFIPLVRTKYLYLKKTVCTFIIQHLLCSLVELKNNW
jgi:hypothetical protein